MRATFLRQMKAVLWRNVLLKRRNASKTFQEIFFPLLYVGILVMIRALTKPSTKPSLTFPQVPLVSWMLNTSQPLLVVDNGLTSVSSVMNSVSQRYHLQYHVFSTQAQADAAYEANKSDVTVGIIFGYPDTSAIEQYAIRMPRSDIADTQSTLTKNQGQCRGADNEFGTGLFSCDANTYLMRGFAFIQKIIDEAIMKELGYTVNTSVSVNMMPKGEYTTDITTIQTISSLYFVIAYSFFVNFLSVSLVAEKENKIREGMYMMGLRNSVFWLSWTVVYFVVILVVTALVTAVSALGSFFPNSNMFIFFLMLMLYGMSMISFSFLLTPFFDKAKVAGIFASFSTMLISLIYLVVSQTRTVTATEYNETVPPAVQWVLCIFSPVALALAVDKGLYLDVAKSGMHFDDSMTSGEFPLYAPILMLFIDVVAYFLLAVYFDHVIPGEYGPRYKPWYFLQKSYWFSQKTAGGDRLHLFHNQELDIGESEVTGPNIEPMAAEMSSKRTMRLLSISKAFKSKEANKKDQQVFAVKNLSLDIYEGQITCLLGHNGAGKTTLINMLTGVMPPTAGTGLICGLDVSCSADMVEIRSMCGICPQHNIIYNELTAREHLIIFAGIKGVPQDRVDSEVKRALENVDLADQADVLASKLSGGQKRKLSVAMALIGNPKIIFLDEPTAGMDPYSRRHLWSLLKNSKAGRVILLTTHFMDEADILADRKAIISRGQLKCCGSSLFLKSRFGIGYHLNMVVEPSCDADKVLSFLRQYVTGVEFDRSHGKELSYTIPLSQVSKFSELFLALETQEGSESVSKTLGIQNYGVSMPTLEEVFLKLGETDVVENNQSHSSSLSQVDMQFSKTEKNRHENNHTEIQMRANRNTAHHQTLSQATVDQPAYCFWMMFRLRFLGFWRVKIALLFLVIMPIGLVTGAMILYKVASPKSGIMPVPRDLRATTYANTNANTQLPNFVIQDSANDATSKAIVTNLQSQFHVDSYPPSTNLSDTAPHYVGAHLKTTANNNLASYTALYNDTAVHSLPAAINAISCAVLKRAGSSANITTSSYPWTGESKEVFNGGSFGSTIMIGIAFALIMPAFGTTVVQERELKCKSQLRVSGVSFHLYWGAMFVFDLLVALIPATVCLIIALAFRVPSFSSAGALVIMVFLFIVYIPCALMAALVCSFLFNKYETAQAILSTVFLWFGMIPYLLVSLIDGLASQKAATIMHYIFVFTDPVYPIFGGFYYIDRLYGVHVIINRDLTFGDYFDFENKIIICIIGCIVDMVAMYFLLRVLEVRSNGGSACEAFRFGDINAVASLPQRQMNNDVIDDEDDDVRQERHHVERLEQDQESSQNCVAYVSQLRKEFVKTATSNPCMKPTPEEMKLAVRNLSFSVNKGEVFGLLGPNGAGKTTALSMMTAEVHPSKGKVVIANCQVRSNVSDAFRNLGFCPQHDPLWENITLEEHLEMYAAFRGIPRNEIPAIIDFFVENLQIQEHRNKHTKNLSGGTKRKLCYAIAMLGSPKIVLLDEPSTGMDPQSKRFLWDTISSSFEGQERGAILTTHYMEEADALCTRVGIMVNGQMECLGPTQHLKAKYGSGYLLEVKIGGSSRASHEELEEKVAALERHLLDLFPNASCLESFAERAQYKIPLSDVPTLSLVFIELEKMKQSHNVEEYSFSQSTLEQVFLNFAKRQLEEGEDIDAKTKNRLERQLSRSDPAASSRVVVRM